MVGIANKLLRRKILVTLLVRMAHDFAFVE